MESVHNSTPGATEPPSGGLPSAPSSAGTSEPYELPSSPYQRDGAVARCGFRAHEEFSSSESGLYQGSPGSGAQQPQMYSPLGDSPGGMTTVTEDGEPYDDDQPLFVQASKEREVSVALCHVGCASTAHSQGTLCSPDGTPIRQSSQPPQHPIPPLPTRDAIQQFAKQHSQKPSPPESPAIYSNSAAQLPWQAGNHTIVVKVPIQKAMTENSQPAEKPATSAVADNAAPRDVMSDGDEWETVGTSVGGPNNNRVRLPNSAAVGRYGANITGSSIADFSDEPSVRMGGSRDGFSSTDRIVQDSPAQGTLGESSPGGLQVTSRHIFVPKQRTHRVNGYPQNSSRMFSNPTSSNTGPSSKESFSDKLPQPFRSHSVRSKLTSLGNPYENLERGSKFEFRESACFDEEEYAVARARQDPKGKGKENAPEPSKPQSRYARLNLGFPGEPQRPAPAAHPGVAQMGREFSPTQFNFPLIPLPEAARIQARLRAEGKQDQTYLGKDGDNLGASSSRNSTLGSSSTPIAELTAQNSLLKRKRSESRDELFRPRAGV